MISTEVRFEEVPSCRNTAEWIKSSLSLRSETSRSAQLAGNGDIHFGSLYTTDLALMLVCLLKSELSRRNPSRTMSQALGISGSLSLLLGCQEGMQINSDKDRRARGPRSCASFIGM